MVFPLPHPHFELQQAARDPHFELQQAARGEAIARFLFIEAGTLSTQLRRLSFYTGGLIFVNRWMLPILFFLTLFSWDPLLMCFLFMSCAFDRFSVLMLNKICLEDRLLRRMQQELVLRPEDRINLFPR